MPKTKSKINFLLTLLILTSILLSCTPKTEREIEVERLEKSALEILEVIKDEIEYADENNHVVWRPNMERVEREWNKIHLDSAELGLRYVNDFDSLFLLNTERKIEQERAKRKKRNQEIYESAFETVIEWTKK